MKIFLHIGTHKTGTTSLQVFLRESENALARQGILVPDSGSPKGKSYNVSCGHHELAWYLLGKHNTNSDASWTALSSEIAQYNGEKVVVSAEAFDNLTTSHIVRIKKYLSGHDIYPVIYLRNPLSYMVSAYKQRIKMGTYSGTLRKYFKEHIDNVDYEKLVGAWISELGKDNLRIRIFDKAKHRGIEKDFCDVIGADFIELKNHVQKRANISPTDRDIQIMRRINSADQLYSFQSRYDIGAILRKQVMKNKSLSPFVTMIFGLFLSGELVRKKEKMYLHQLIDDKQESFLSKYIPEEDHHFFKF